MVRFSKILISSLSGLTCCSMTTSTLTLTYAIQSSSKRSKKDRPSLWQLMTGAAAGISVVSGASETNPVVTPNSNNVNNLNNLEKQNFLFTINDEIWNLDHLLQSKNDDIDNSAMKQKFFSFAGDLGRDYVVKRVEDVAPGEEIESASGSSSPSYQCHPDKIDECETRYRIFVDSVQQAHERNLDSRENHGSKVVHGITKYSDVSDAEFEKFFMGYKESSVEDMEKIGAKKWFNKDTKDNHNDITATSSSSSSNTEFLNAKTEPQSSTSSDDVNYKDWRNVGAMITPVKNQLHCGSCWAHSVIENVEALAIRDKIVGDDFRGSVQELVSCDTGIDNGCNGGSPMFGFYYLGSTGLETEKEYPYTSGTGIRGSCKLDKSLGEVETGEIWQFDGEQDMQNYIFKSDTTGGPISIAVYALPWKTYKSGVLPADQCLGQIDHAVQAVGLDLRDPENKYWIVRNSWGADWGENGYIRLPYGVGACSLDKQATYADVKKPSLKDSESDAMDVEEVV